MSWDGPILFAIFVAVLVLAIWDAKPDEHVQRVYPSNGTRGFDVVCLRGVEYYNRTHALAPALTKTGDVVPCEMSIEEIRARSTE